jgi:hypothetical protein
MRVFGLACFLLTVIAVAFACGTVPSPMASPIATGAVPAATTVPMAAPTAFAVVDDVFAEPESAEMDIRPVAPTVAPVIESLGYALVPKALPNGFALNVAEILVFPADITARQVYLPEGDGSKTSGALELDVTYPMRFTPGGDSFFEQAGFQVPDDVMEPIPFGSTEAYLITGGWDPDTMRILQPYLARWDYERSLTVMFLYPDTPDGPVWVAVRAELSTKWITPEELVGVAESMLRVD